MTTVINEKIENLRSMGPPVKDDPNLNEASMGEAYWWYATNRDESALARRQEIIIKHGVACQYLLYCIDSFSRMEDVRLKSLLIVAETSSEVPEKDTNEHVRPRTTRRNKAHWNLLETDQLQQELFSRIKKRCYETPKFSSVELSLYSMTSDRNELISKIMWDDGAKLIDEDCRIHGMSGGERARWNDRRVRAVDYSNGFYTIEWCPVDINKEKVTAWISYQHLTCWDPQRASLVFDSGANEIGPFNPRSKNPIHRISYMVVSHISSIPYMDIDRQTTILLARATTRAQRRSMAREEKKLTRKKLTTVQTVPPAAKAADLRVTGSERVFKEGDGTGKDKPKAVEHFCQSRETKNNVLSSSDVGGSDGTKQEHPMPETPVTSMAELATEVPDEGPVNVSESAGERFMRRLKEFSLRPRMAPAKFRCPKDKEPGDTMTVRHPHCENRILELIIPPYAKAGKAFSIQIPIPQEIAVSTCVLCDEILPEVGDFDEKERAPLRVCDHVCCNQCHDVLSGRYCPACEAPIPSVTTLELLPLIQHMGNSLPLREALLEEYFLNKQHEADPTNKDIAKKKEVAAQNSVKVIDKHYRRESIKVHPDRFGDTFRQDFDELTKAKDILGNVTLRESYLDPMISIACKLDEKYIPYSHTMWMQNNDPGKRGQARSEAKAVTSSTKPKMQLEGGLMYSFPRKPMILSTAKRNMVVCMVVKDEDQFKQYCQQLSLYGSCSDVEAEEVTLAVITNPDFDIFFVDGGIRVSVNVPVKGIWDISWSFTVSFDEGKSAQETPRSASSRVDLRPNTEKSLYEKIEELVPLAKGLTSKLQNDVSSPIPVGRSQVLRRYNKLHSNIVQAVNLCTKLKAAVDDPYDVSYRFIIGLEDQIKASTEQRNLVEKIVRNYDKKATRKQFRRTVVEQLQSSGAQEWIASVTPGDLAEKGGDANSLYQFLVERKKTNSDSLDESILVTAGNREDLFTDKQRQLLKDRVMAVSVTHGDPLEQLQREKEIEGINATRIENVASDTRGALDEGMGSGMSDSGIPGPSSCKVVAPFSADVALLEDGSDVSHEGQHSYAQNVIVDFKTVGKVVGKNHKNLISIMKTTGTKIKISKQKQSAETVTFVVSSQLQTNVDEAAKQLLQAAGVSHRIPAPPGFMVRPELSLTASVPKDTRVPAPVTCNNYTVTDGDTATSTFPETSSISSTLTGDDDIMLGAVRTATVPTGSGMIGGIPLLSGVIKTDDWNTDESLRPPPTRYTLPVSPVTHSSTPQSSLCGSPTEKDGLLNFLIHQRDCFKVPPTDFLDWLSSQDIVSLSDLRDACEDHDFLSVEMREAGLKGFKKNSFVKAVWTI